MENTVQNTGKSTQECLNLLSLPLEEFMQRAGELLAEESLWKEIWQDVLDCLQKEDIIKYMFLLYHMAEMQLLQIVKMNTNPAHSIHDSYGVSEMMESCVRTGRAFYEALYRPECFSERGMVWMPVDCQYNDILICFLNGGKKELSMLLKAAKLKPVMTPVIKVWLAELAKK